MTARPTGHYVLKDDGLYLQFDRLFHAPIEDVWFSLTNPNAMRAWIGTYTGSPATGGVRFRMESAVNRCGAAHSRIVTFCHSPSPSDSMRNRTPPVAGLPV